MKNNVQSYSKVIYSRKAIEKAISDYMHIANIKIKENRTHYICTFSRCVVDEQRVLYEFNNYLYITNY